MPENKNLPTFCYFGIYQPTWARDTVLLQGLKALGAQVIFLVDSSSGWRKYFRLARIFRQLKQPYDYLFVGYLSNVVVPLARLLSKRPVIFNAGNSMYEGAVLDRGHYSWLKKERYLWFMDWLAFHLAHLVLIETEAQKEFICQIFNLSPQKLFVLPIGADNQVFFPESKFPKQETFTVLFRGWFIPATGVEYVLAAAKILKNKDINFLLIGRGPLLGQVKRMIQEFDLAKVKLITDFLTPDELRRQMLSCHLSLGQFANHPRLERTIQNKTFESLALGLPYLTRDSKSNRELLTDGENCLFTKPADAQDLAKKILILKNNPDLREKLAQNALTLYQHKLTPKILAAQLLKKICG